MGIEANLFEVKLPDTSDSNLKIIRHNGPAGEEYEIHFQDQLLLFLGLQEKFYAAFWQGSIARSRFVKTLTGLGVPPSAESLLWASGSEISSSKTLATLSEHTHIPQPKPAQFVQVNTDHLGFTWQRGTRHPTRPAVVGLSGNQFNTLLFERYYNKTADHSLPHPVIEAAQDLLKDFRVAPSHSYHF